MTWGILDQLSEKGVCSLYTGSSAQSIAGTLAAVEQIEVTGEPTIDGSIIA